MIIFSAFTWCPLMFILKLLIKNKMNEVKKLFQSFGTVGPLAFAVGVPWIIFKMVGAAYLQKGYNELVGKIVVITGASSGIGEALAHEFYKYGCQVVLCARRRQELERVRTDLLHTHCNITTLPPIIIPLDLTNTKELASHVDKILSITGKIDILVNNGGAGYRGNIVDTMLDVDMKLMTVNYFGAVALTKAVLKTMIKKKQGHIVFVSSVQGLIAIPERSAYSASKHALQAFSDSLRTEVAAHNIEVTTASPGYVKTKFSINAVTSTGKQYGVMDETTANGYSPEYVAHQILKALVMRKKEIVVSPLLPRIGIFLRRFFPHLYFYLMERRARKGSLGILLNNINENVK